MESTVNLSILVALGGGLLSFLSPCVLPLFPSYLSLITGMSFDDLKDREHIGKMVVFHSVSFILGFSTVFVLLGASFSLLGGLFAGYHGIIQRIAGLTIIFFGLYITGVFRIPLFTRSKEVFRLRKRPAGHIGSALVGIAFGFAWTPCVGPILGAILALAATSKEMGGGVVLLTAYSLGLAIPFILGSLALHSFLKVIQKYRNIFHVVYVAGGILLIIVGILIFAGYFTALNSVFIEFTPSWLWEKI